MKNLIACVLVLGSGTGAAIQAAPDASAASERRTIVDRIDDYRQATWRWQSLMGKRRTPTVRSERREASTTRYRYWVLNLWKVRADKVKRQAASPPHRSAWTCLQRYEAGWQAKTGNGYYGGLQMDLTFQRTYGAGLLRRKGTANNWTPIEQMWVGERALRAGRGFHPWPNAARRCGLI